jgi:N4-(beta-N-acetylglucosaminyl)-L-asparaginase
MTDLNRREFVAMSGAALAGGAAAAAALTAQPQPEVITRPRPGADQPGDAHRGPCFISSGNGLRVTGRAMELLTQGQYVLDAIVAGIKIVEDDPADNSVGYGGLPNEEGVVQLDASVMDGPSARAGSVGAIESIKNPAAVALQVLRKTGHVMLVGAGALKFARQMGFPEENLLTEESRQAWLRWKSTLNPDDWWLDPDQQIRAPSGPSKGQSSLDVPYTTGTVHCSGVDAKGQMGSATSTSGLSWKLPGRLGDSPIVGAGMYCDNDVGGAGATGRGESVIQVCGSFSVVQHLAAGKSPTEACLAVLKKIADKTKEPRLLDDKNRPIFDVTMYALRKDGAYGSASMWQGTSKGKQFAVHDGTDNRLAPCAFLYEGAPPPAQPRR